MAKLNKVQKYYISGNRTESVKQIAKDLGVTEQSVANYLKTLVDETVVEAAPVAEAKPKKFKKPDVFARDKHGRGVVAMTAAASERGDENFKKVAADKAKNNPAIFKIKQDEE